MSEEYFEGWEDGWNDALEKAREHVLELHHDAIAQLRRGDNLDALTTLERHAFPKWGSASESRQAYLAHMASGQPAANAGEVG